MVKRFPGTPGCLAARYAAAFAAALVAAGLLFAGEPPPDPAWQRAGELFGKRLWLDAEKSLLVYSKRFPAPPRQAEALVRAGQCRLMLRDPAGARRHFEKAAYDETARRKSPGAVAEAFDRLHKLHLDEGKPPALRARVIDDCRRRLPGCAELRRMCEREGDALLADNLPGKALDFYAAAGAGLSPGGTNTARLLRGCMAANPPPLSDDDISLLSGTLETKPACTAALCGLLAKRGEGWLAEDARAWQLMGSGKASVAAALWETMLRGRRGPADRIALARCGALAADDPGKGLEAFGAWLGQYPESPLRERAEAEHALLMSRHGDLAGAVSCLESFLKKYPGSRYATGVDKALANARNASERMAQIEAAQSARAEALRHDPDLAGIERAEALLAKGRCDVAAKVFMSFRNRRLHPLWGRAWYGLGRARHAAGDTEGALSAWDDVWLRSRSGTNVLYAARARRAAGDAWLEDLGAPDRALKAYDEAAALDPAIADAAFDLNRGLALLTIGRAPEAAAVFSRRRGLVEAGDQAEILRWDNLVKQCAAGQAPPLRAQPPAVRRARADLALADGLFEGREYCRALKLYRRSAKVLAGREGADRCDLQTALALAALGRPKEALDLYARFGGEHRRSPLAPAALLYAGTLCAGPRKNDFAGARKWFAMAAAEHPGTREAEAAEFYTATLAWRGRKWTEAEKLHKAFAANHPGSPLARVALDQRLPAIGKKSLAVPLHDPIDRVLEVFVRPNDRKRKAIPITTNGAYNAHLDIKPASGYKLIDSAITDQNSRGAGDLWTGPEPKSDTLHRYHLAKAYSSREYVIIDGTVTKPGPGGGTGQPPPFRVTVPTVDVDWEGFAAPGDEVGEETRFVVVPLTTNAASHRWIQVNVPYDDYGPVHSIMTLHWEDANDLQLRREDGTLFPNGGQIDSRTVPSWPLRFRVEPLSFTPEFVVRLMGEADNVTGEKAVDTILGRIVKLEVMNGETIINENDIAPITATPAMPNLTARLLGGTQTMQIQWRLHIYYYQGNRQDDSHFPGPTEAGRIALAGNQVWNIADLFGQNFYGGNATLIAQVDQTELTHNFRIHGLNAGQSAIRGRLALLRHHLIAWKESRFQEFRNNPADVIMNFAQGPFPVLRTFDNGFGVMQLTSLPITINQLWDWRANVDEGESRADACTARANAYNDQVQQGLPFTGGPPDETPPNEGTAYPNAPEFTAEQLDRETWSRYNSGYRYHNYDPDTGTWVPRSSTAPGSVYADDLATRRDAILQNNQYPPLWGQ